MRQVSLAAPHFVGLRGGPNALELVMSHRKSKDIAQAISNEGLVSDIFQAIAHKVMARGGNLEHLRRVANEQDLQDEIAELIVPSETRNEQSLADCEYRVPVAYDMPRDKETLEAEFSKGGVSELFYGNYEWELYESCAKIDQAPGERIMLVKHYGLYSKYGTIIRKMGEEGYRPATHLELYAFSKCHPRLQFQFQIIGLGSMAKRGGEYYVPVLDITRSRRRILEDLWAGGGGAPKDRFLFVRK